MEQTAVEFMANELLYLDNEYDMKLIDKNEYQNKRKSIIEEAKDMERDQRIAFGKRCFYEGFEKAENGDANCFTAWRESVDKLLTFKSE